MRRSLHSIQSIVALRQWSAAETAPIWIIATSKFLALAADRALDVQLVITASKLAQFDLERRVAVGTLTLPLGRYCLAI